MGSTSGETESPWSTVLGHLADLELAAVQQFRPYLDLAPTLEDRWQLMQCQKDQMGGARSLLKLATGHGLSPAQEQRLMFLPLGDHALSGTQRTLPSWDDAAAHLVVMEESHIALLQLLSGRGDEPFDKYARAAIIEKEVHVRFGLLVLRRLANRTTLATAQQVLRSGGPMALETFDTISAAAGTLVPTPDLGAARTQLQQRLEQAAVALAPIVPSKPRRGEREEPTGAYG